MISPTSEEKGDLILPALWPHSDLLYIPLSLLAEDDRGQQNEIGMWKEHGGDHISGTEQVRSGDEQGTLLGKRGSD